MENEKDTSSALQRLMEMDDEVVPASAIAPIIKMHQSVMIDHVRKGEWNLCATVQSGDHVKFFRRDFLRRCGFLNENEDVLSQILSQLDEIRQMLEEIRDRGENRV